MSHILNSVSPDPFGHGYLIAVANMVSHTGLDDVGRLLIAELGITWPKVEALGLSEFDIEILAPLFTDELEQSNG